MDVHTITGIGLCAGVGWLDLSVKLAWEHLGYRYRTLAFCERDSYAASVILARMDDSSLERAAICDSLEDIDERFRGVDCLVAGLPCQPWSCAGKQEGKDDDRWLWPLFCEVIRKVEPKWVFLENVPGLVGGEMEGELLDISADDDSRGLSLILGSLADLGFDAEWLCLPASAVGASHKRNRWFCVAHRTKF